MNISNWTTISYLPRRINLMHHVTAKFKQIRTLEKDALAVKIKFCRCITFCNLEIPNILYGDYGNKEYITHLVGVNFALYAIAKTFEGYPHACQLILKISQLMFNSNKRRSNPYLSQSINVAQDTNTNMRF